MKVLVVGGTGLLGGDAAVKFQQEGHEVAIAARKPPPAGTPMAKMPLVLGDFIEGSFTKDQLSGFDALVFAAGSDIRHIKPGTTEEEHWIRANAEATPRFFELARDAGIKRATLLGTFYMQAAPELIETSPYIASRHLADLRVRDLASESYHVTTVNPPYVVGHLDGIFAEHLAAFVSFALGRLPIPRTSPMGGANFVTTQALSQSLYRALTAGENGKAYLIGDENWSYQEYIEQYFKAVGDTDPVPAADADHPLIPDLMLYAGRGGVVYYDTDPADTEFLGYAKQDVTRAIKEIVEAYRPAILAQPAG